ncbi:hypothetical protein AB205_0081910 [Aquarana catesbeiana]|uniref:Uncharacterized protein n=1 Tax=Aquarana catesbeiana TaxID=8400 RepID=A0A2G9RIP9_AQUCT|nr:hypothetical protein AB205_0081910 [Aquarana catesbeiana]
MQHNLYIILYKEDTFCNFFFLVFMNFFVLFNGGRNGFCFFLFFFLFFFLRKGRGLDAPFCIIKYTFLCSVLSFKAAILLQEIVADLKILMLGFSSLRALFIIFCLFFFCFSPVKQPQWLLYVEF